MKGFRARLAERQSKVGSLVCVGLDPLAEKLPGCLRGQKDHLARDVEVWMSKIAAVTGEFASMFKPQDAHWAAIPGGTEALGRTIARIHQMFPDIPVFLDCKRGDIARTQGQYRVACLDNLAADGMNFSPYMGKDCMAALVDKENIGRALVGLCYTSNPDAREVQDTTLANGRFLWQQMARWIMQWAVDLGVLDDAGLVMAAAYEKPKGSGIIFSDHLRNCRQLVGDKMWFLIPGIGAQGGFIEETVRTAYAGPGSIAINSSSEINFASSDDNFAEAAAQKAKELRDAINNAIKA